MNDDTADVDRLFARLSEGLHRDPNDYAAHPDTSRKAEG